MDTTLIRVVCGVLALVFGGVIYMRRRRTEE
jgi:hypothetical protein